MTSVLTRPVAVDEVIAAALSEKDNIEWLDHSDFAMWSEDEDSYITLGYMIVPEAASNNCMACSDAVVEFVDRAVCLAEGARVGTVELAYTNGVHWAVVIESSGERWAVDFTARQFDYSAMRDRVPFPLVEPLDHWKSTIDGWIAAQFGEGPSNLRVVISGD